MNQNEERETSVSAILDKKHVSRDKKALMPRWMSEDEEGVYNYAVVPVWNPDAEKFEYFGIDDDYFTREGKPITITGRKDITESIAGRYTAIYNNIFCLVNLPKCLGIDEPLSDEIYILSIDPKALSYPVGLAVNRMPEFMRFSGDEMINPRDDPEDNSPVYLPRMIKKASMQDPVNVLSLEALLMKDYEPKYELARTDEDTEGF
ncbi:MAG: hypothetical protein R6U32_07420 [Candidatus Woesearchaeota archaeon]